MILVFWYGFSVPISGMCVIGVRSGQWCTRRCGFRTPCPRHRIETTPEQMKNIPQNFYGSLLRTIKVFADYSVSKLKQTLKKSSKAVVTSAWHLNWKQSRTCILVVSSWQSHLLVLFVLLFFFVYHCFNFNYFFCCLLTNKYSNAHCRSPTQMAVAT